tara:strand:+ start:727 stop:1167 length:441 start_codon:yes stop_codon:yes gene_type:complete
MSKGSLNKVMIIGNLGSEPDELRYTPNGVAVTNLSVATSYNFKDSQGENQLKTEWHRVVFFNRLAEIACQYLAKGSKVFLEGQLRTRKWQDKNGQERYTTEIIGNDLRMLDKKGETNDMSQFAPEQAPAASEPSNSPSITDDDIPF